MQPTALQLTAAAIFAIALVHTFSTKFFERLADRHPRHAGVFHLLGEVEIVFGFWAAVFILVMTAMTVDDEALVYLESRHYTEPLFVFAVMVVAASSPVRAAAESLLSALAKLMPLPTAHANAWLALAVVPLMGSLITEPAAMTLAALMLRDSAIRRNSPEWVKYAFLGVLFVNVSIGGTLTAYAAPPVLMVASKWGWTSGFMFATFGWKAAVAVAINATGLVWLVRRHLTSTETPSGGPGVSGAVQLVHLGFLGGIVFFSHHPVVFLSLLVFFMGFTAAYPRGQEPLILKEALLVAFFLAGLVVLGGMQQWWLQPLVSALSPKALFFGSMGLTAITDNAALTYLGSLIAGLSDEGKRMLMSGAVVGGGLTIIANAPNPAGASLLRRQFEDEAIGPMSLLLAAALPTTVAAILFLL